MDESAIILYVLAGMVEIVLVYYAYRIAQKTGFGRRGQAYVVGFALIALGRFVLAALECDGAPLDFIRDFGLLLILVATIIITLGFRQFLSVVSEMLGNEKNG